jgi:hypothetical protein
MKSFHKPLQPACGMLQRSVASCQAAMQLVPFPNPVVARDPATIIMIRYDQTALGNDTRLVWMFFFPWGFEPLNARCFGRFFYLVAYSGTWCWMCVWWFRQMKHFQPDFFFPGVCSGMSTSKPRRSTFSLISWNSSLPSQIGNISVLYMLWTGLPITSRITDSTL